MRNRGCVPHPEIVNRSFVLVPLLELDPTLRHPETGEPLIECLQRLKTTPPTKIKLQVWFRQLCIRMYSAFTLGAHIAPM